MAGGLMQLVAYGAQDVFLTGTPEITFWKVSYRRHTNFAMESIEQTFSGQADFGRRVTCTISRNGDLAYRTYLQVTLPEIGKSSCGGTDKGVYARWLDCPGEQIVSTVEVEIGGQRIDRQSGQWMDTWNELSTSESKAIGLKAMTGQIGTAMYVAPEINAGKVIAAYSQKVDIYSLGVIFFEMCHPPLTTGMERIKILSALRYV